MAGILKCDQVQSDSNLSFQVAGANVAYMNSTGLSMTGGQIIAGSNTLITSSGLIYANAGIKFPATQSVSADANTLDDYEEGIVAYPLALGASGGTTITSGYGSNYCSYTKIGNTVNCFYYFDITVGSTGYVNLNLPFVVHSSLNFIHGLDIYSSQYGYASQGVWLNAGYSYAIVAYDLNINNNFNLTSGNRFYMRSAFTYCTNN
jgi:hypothetical protein